MSSTPDALAPVRIGVCEKNQNPYWDMVNAGWNDAAARLGLELDIRAPEHEDVAAQRRHMTDLIEEGVDALAFVGTRLTEFDDIVSRAQSQGIRVATFDLDSAVEQRSLFVGMAPSRDMGRNLGALIADAVPAGSTVLVQTGSDKAPGAVGKLAGLLEVFEERGSRAAVGESDGEDLARAASIADELFAAHPQAAAAVGVYGYHPSILAAAARRARSGLLVFGFDMLPETVELLQAGEVAASVWISEYYFGYYTAAALSDLVRLGDDAILGLYGMSTSAVASNVLIPPVRVFTPTNIHEFVVWSDTHDIAARTARMPIDVPS